jgi:predicted kinase
VPLPLLVVVTGMPAAGKTTLAESLSRSLGVPLIAKDRIKERLYETLGVGDDEWSDRLGRAAFELLFDAASLLVGAGHSVVVEANFYRGLAEPRLRELPEHRLVQIHCTAPLDVLLTRYRNRPRHAGHRDREKVGLLPERLESGAHEPLDLPGELIRVDTSQPVDTAAIAARLGRQLP